MQTVSAGGVELAYLEDGDPTAPLAVCLHGFPDSPASLSGLAAALAAAGYHAVRPWLRGYPPSQVVAGSYQGAALARDVVGLVDALSPHRPAVVVGHDWGGLAAYGAAVLAPERVDRIVVLGVAPSSAFRSVLRESWVQQQTAWYQFLFQVEPMAEEVVSRNDFAFLERLWRAWSPGWEPDPELLTAAVGTVREGFPAALLYYRDAWQPARRDPALAADQRRIFDGPVDVPALVLYGLRDGCVLPPCFAAADGYFAGPHAIEGLDDVGHFLHLQAPQRVSDRVVAFLTAPQAPAAHGRGSA